jgi:hypothetical protein
VLAAPAAAKDAPPELRDAAVRLSQQLFDALATGDVALWNRDLHVRGYGTAVVVDCEDYEQETVHGQRLVVRYLSTLTFVREAQDLTLVALQSVTLPTQPPVLSVPDLHLDDYPGTYRWGPDRAHTVAVRAGQLTFTTRAGGTPTGLDPIARDVFMDAGE